MTGETEAAATAIGAPAAGFGVGRIVLASLIGTAIEFYDFYIYGTAAALVIGQTFFPQSAPQAQAALPQAAAEPAVPPVATA